MSPAPQSESRFDDIWSLAKGSQLDSGHSSNLKLIGAFDDSTLGGKFDLLGKNSKSQPKGSLGMDGLDFLGLNAVSLTQEKITEKETVQISKTADWNVLLESNSKAGVGGQEPLISKPVFKKPLLKKKPIKK